MSLLDDLSNVDLSSMGSMDAGSDPSLFDFSSLSLPDFSSTLAPPVNLSSVLPGQTGGGSSFLSDINGLVSTVFQGQAQADAAKNAAALAAARQANQLQTIQTTPNVWLVASVVGVGAFVLLAMDKSAKVAANTK